MQICASLWATSDSYTDRLYMCCKILQVRRACIGPELLARSHYSQSRAGGLALVANTGHNMAAVRCAFQTLPTLHTLKTCIIRWKSFNNHLISCENYLSIWKCATNPELSKVCNVNEKVKYSTKLYRS